MKNYHSLTISSVLLLFMFCIQGCQSSTNQETESDKVAANIKMYTQVWDDIVNKKQLDLINETNFTQDIVFHMSPEDVVGIEASKEYYETFLNGFTDISFTINDVFGQGDKIVKHWTFKGKHTGDFFGILPTGNSISLEGVTLVRMENGKIAEEQDFIDNYALLQQLDVIPQE